MYSLDKTQLAPGIVSYKNVIPDPKGFIDDLEGLVSINALSWSDATQSNSSGGESMVSKDIRRCSVISIPPFDKVEFEDQKNDRNPYYLLHQHINELLLPAMNDYKNEYGALQWDLLEGWQILKYESDNFFVNHFDDSKNYKRTVSMSFYLNKDFEGGEMEFPRFGLKIKPEENQMVCFPSNYVYNHVVHPVTSGIRYAIVGWWE